VRSSGVFTYEALECLGGGRGDAWTRLISHLFVPAEIGPSGMHFHNLRDPGNAFAAASGAGLCNRVAPMGHDR
jgi:hypothetical protein